MATTSRSTGRLAIHEAARAGSIKITKLLMNSGSNVNARDHEGRGVLHAAFHSGSMKIMSLLLDHGAEINALDLWNVNVVFYSLDSLHLLNFLVDLGANINQRDLEGDTLLLQAIHENSIEKSQVLIDRGADYTVVNQYGQGVLHFLALYGDVETIRTFTALRMRGVEVDRLTNMGRTPRQLFQERSDIGEEPEFLGLRRAFDELLASVDADGDVESVALGSGPDEGSNTGSIMSDSRGEDEFFDTMEHQRLG